MPKPLRVHPKLIKGYGWKPGLPRISHPLYSARVELDALPPKVDLRPECPPVYDQGQLGSCTGNGWAGAVEFLFKKQGLQDFTPSRLFIYYNERVLDNDAEYVEPLDMLAELMDDNKTFAARLREAHNVCYEHRDVATASFIEVWIDETERRTWFLFEATRRKN